MTTPDAMAPLVRAGAGLERRAFLRLAGMLAVAGCVPTGCGGVPPRWQPGPEVRLQALSPRGYATFNAAAARIVGPTGAAMIEQRTVDAALVADGLLARAPALAGPLGQALTVLEFGIWPLVAKVRAFTALAPAAQDAVLDDLMRSSWTLKRQLFGGVRSLALLAFYTQPQSRVVSGYPGPFGSERIPIGAAMVGAADGA